MIAYISFKFVRYMYVCMYVCMYVYEEFHRKTRYIQAVFHFSGEN